jgi:PAS domain S-box-containing protein
MAEEKEILRRLRVGERIEGHETVRVTRDGRPLDVSITISPMRDAEGTIIGASKILRDITESKQTHNALRESEERLANEAAAATTLHAISTRLISESTQESLFEQILDAAIQLMAADAGSLQMLAPDGESLTLLGCKNFHDQSAVFWQHVTAEANSTCGRALRTGERVLVSDVERCDVTAGTPDLEEYRRSGIRAVQSTPLRSRSGGPLGMISTHWRTPHTPTEHDFKLFDVLARQAADLIERALAAQAIRESERRFRLIANSAPVVIWMTDADSQCTYVNQQWLELTGQSFEAALGRGWIVSTHPDDVGPTWNVYEKAFARREPFEMEYRVRRQAGDYRWVVARGVPRNDVDGSFGGYIGSAVDVTDRKLAEDAMSTISQRLIEAQEQQSAHIARELHDDINQRLSLIAARLGALAHASAETTTTDTGKIKDAQQEATELVKDVQALSHRLHPSQLEHLGLVEASAAMCRDISSQLRVAVNFDADIVPKELPYGVKLCVYRVLQEALQNAIKHSGARKVSVSLRAEPDRIELTVADRGKGFDVKTTDGHGLGLASMKERLKAVDGQLAIRSEPGQGTSIRARVPVRQQR